MKRLGVALFGVCVLAALASPASALEAAPDESGRNSSNPAAGNEAPAEGRTVPGHSPARTVIARNGDRIAGKPPSLVRGISHRNYPRGVQRRWPRGGAIFLRLLVEPNGRPSECDVVRSFGDAEADRWTCRLITERGRFRPAVNERGEPVAAWYGYVQADVGLMAR